MANCSNMTPLEQSEFLARMFMLYPKTYDDIGAGEISAIKELYKEVIRQREYISRLEHVVEACELFVNDIEKTLNLNGVLK